MGTHLLMASQKVRPTALQHFFETSTYNRYAFTLEKPLRLVVRNFSLAILLVFAKSSPIKCCNALRSPFALSA